MSVCVDVRLSSKKFLTLGRKVTVKRKVESVENEALKWRFENILKVRDENLVLKFFLGTAFRKHTHTRTHTHTHTVTTHTPSCTPKSRPPSTSIWGSSHTRSLPYSASVVSSHNRSNHSPLAHQPLNWWWGGGWHSTLSRNFQGLGRVVGWCVRNSKKHFAGTPRVHRGQSGDRCLCWKPSALTICRHTLIGFQHKCRSPKRMLTWCLKLAKFMPHLFMYSMPQPILQAWLPLLSNISAIKKTPHQIFFI